MNDISKIVLAIVGFILVVGFVIYGIYGLTTVIVEVLSTPPQVERAPNATEIDMARCREAGGFPRTSSWDGRFIECNSIK